jgi:hypothetical protein
MTFLELQVSSNPCCQTIAAQCFYTTLAGTANAAWAWLQCMHCFYEVQTNKVATGQLLSISSPGNP